MLHRDGEAPPEMGMEDMETGEEPQQEQGEVNWLQRARDAYYASTSYVDGNYRKKWEDSIRAFNNQHPMDSKYTSLSYAKRSNLYRPKLRAIIRKNEAAAAAAFFSNLDMISTEATNQADTSQRASAEVMKQLLEYRLRKSIPWYKFVIGGLQDAQTQGVVIAHMYWEYEEGKIDKPCADLIPVENFRIDPAASWYDPVGTSPYIIEIIPMYVGEVKERMNRVDPKTGDPQWKSLSEADIKMATQTTSDSTRISRNKDRADPTQPDDKIVGDYEVVWIQRHIHRWNGDDWTFYTLNDVSLLTDPVPLKQVVFTGERDYIVGSCIIETHKIYPASIPELSKGLIDETNALVNSRIDNLSFVLNKKWFVRRGKNVDIPSLVRNVAGGVTLMDDVGPEGDVQEVNWPDVTSSAYQEQDRINADIVDLVGDFSPAQAQLARRGQEPARNFQMQALAQTPMASYLLMTYVVTFIEPVLSMLAKLEQAYETDQVILTLAGKKAQVFKKYGVDQVTDQLLNQDLTIKLNMSMGATDPMQRLNKFLMGLTALSNFAQNPPPGIAMTEVYKEVFGHLGYQDGGRFYQQDEDPEIAKLKQALQHAGQVIGELGKRVQDKDSERQTKKEIAHEGNVTKLVVADMQQENENLRAAANHVATLHKAKFDGAVKIASGKQNEAKRPSAR